MTAPVLSSLKLLRKRLRLTLSESATVTVVLQRGKRTIRTRVRKLAGGRRSIAFKRAGLRRGRYRILVRAVDDAGNRSKTATLHFRVRRR